LACICAADVYASHHLPYELLTRNVRRKVSVASSAATGYVCPTTATEEEEEEDGPSSYTVKARAR
jgi:hypothetical protein